MQQRSQNSLKQKLTSRNFFSLTSRELKGKTKETMIRLLERQKHRLRPCEVKAPHHESGLIVHVWNSTSIGPGSHLNRKLPMLKSSFTKLPNVRGKLLSIKCTCLDVCLRQQNLDCNWYSYSTDLAFWKIWWQRFFLMANEDCTKRKTPHINLLIVHRLTAT